MAHVSLCRPSDAGAMADAILRAARRAPGAGPRVPGPRDPALSELERDRLVGRIAAVFDEVLGVRPPARRAAA
jgi:hypothetical protein